MNDTATLLLALHQLASEWENIARRADDAEPATMKDLSRMIAAARYNRQHASELRALLDEQTGWL